MKTIKKYIAGLAFGCSGIGGYDVVFRHIGRKIL